MYPALLNQLISVYHIKAYIFDDEIIVTGANLDDFYFSNRLDRYFVIKGKKLINAVINRVFLNKEMKTLKDITIRHENKIMKQSPDIDITNEEDIAGRHRDDDGDNEIIKQSPDISRTREVDIAGRHEDGNNEFMNQGLKQDQHFSRDDELTQKSEVFKDQNYFIPDKVVCVPFTEDQEHEIMKIVLSQKYLSLYITTPYLNFPNYFLELINNRQFYLCVPSPETNTFKDSGWINKIITAVFNYASYYFCTKNSTT